MNIRMDPATPLTASRLSKTDDTSPALVLTGPDSIAIKDGTTFGAVTFRGEASITGHFVAGTDYAVHVMPDGLVTFVAADSIPKGDTVLGGFHFAHGGNATGAAGGDEAPQISPFSLWDVNFRPACPDPRGMVLVEGEKGKFWCDIYLLGVDHLANGTSKFGVTIADGNDPPEGFKDLNYKTARAVMARHGKTLLSLADFHAAAAGVTENSSRKGDPKTAGLDAARTSKWGVMQATGNMWVWGHDGDPDEPRASIFGGSWITRDSARLSKSIATPADREIASERGVVSYRTSFAEVSIDRLADGRCRIEINRDGTSVSADVSTAAATHLARLLNPDHREG